MFLHFKFSVDELPLGNNQEAPTQQPSSLQNATGLWMPGAWMAVTVAAMMFRFNSSSNSDGTCPDNRSQA